MRGHLFGSRDICLNCGAWMFGLGNPGNDCPAAPVIEIVETQLLWQRPSQNQAQSRYHATTNGTPICGAQVRVAMTRPRELTGRQIETQGCLKCRRKTNEGESE